MTGRSQGHRLLTALTVLEVVALVAVLAGYLIAIAAALRRISQSLGKVTFGVRAIERQTQPLAPALTAAAEDLDAAARRLSQHSARGRQP